MTSYQQVPYRPLGIIKTILESLGFEVTHCYEDLVFVEHNAFLLRMEEKGEEVSLLFNMESDEDKRDEIAALIKNEAEKHHIITSCPGTYQMTPNETDGTINLEFQEY